MTLHYACPEVECPGGGSDCPGWYPITVPAHDPRCDGTCSVGCPIPVQEQEQCPCHGTGRVPIDPNAERVLEIDQRRDGWYMRRWEQGEPFGPWITLTPPVAQDATEPAALLAARCNLLGVDRHADGTFCYRGKTFLDANAALVAAWRARHGEA